MPELPDVTVYVEALGRYLEGHTLQRVRVSSPFLVRSYDPPMSEAHGRRVEGFRRVGKRIVWDLEDDLHLVLHLMIAGRLRWKPASFKVPRRTGLAAFDFEHGCVLLTEQGSKKRASLYLVRGDDGVREHDPGGAEVFEMSAEEFRTVLRAKNHTLKRALTDPRILSGIGNAYSDEILHRAGLSPFLRTADAEKATFERLHGAVLEVLTEWTDRLRNQVGESFPDKVTAFHDAMAVHGKYGKPCPSCSAPVQRIVYAANESNYCAQCQTGGKLLRDRALSQLLRDDWPKTLEEMEVRKRANG
ncbi:MAG: formamidopyrimidine-DNA glycosylase [Thermoanaerobaculia bacterium]|nr:formamidopyrimidine-DNA glycosylase [Thermoanaerobaculia bacterium]